MATAAAVATQLTDHSAKPYSILVGGNDLINVANTADNSGGYRIGIDWSSVVVDQRGPDGVSSMSFTVDTPKPALLIPGDQVFAIGTDVLFQDNTLNLPIFRGFIVRYSQRPAFGDVAVSWEVHCDGAEALLDWIFLPVSLTYGAGTRLVDIFQGVIDSSVGVGPLRALGKSSGFSDQAAPMGFTNAFLPTSTTIDPGSLRSIMHSIIDAAAATGFSSLQFTVDFWFGLRMWEVPLESAMPTDWGTLNLLSDGSTNFPEDLDHEFDGSGVVRAAYVLGSNPAFTALVTDGTGKPGQVAYISDPTLTSVAACTGRGLSYLADNAAIIRGSLKLYDKAPTANVWPGCRLQLANTALDIAFDQSSGADSVLRISAITRTFTAKRENWDVTYGPGDTRPGASVAPTNPRGKPSMTELIRHLTRDTLS